LNDFIEKLGLKNVSIKDFGREYLLTYQGDVTCEDSKFLFFETNEGYHLYLVIFKYKNKWHPARVYHDRHYDATEKCPYCKHSALEKGACFAFEHHADELIQKLMNHPYLRLRKIFL